MKSVLFVCFVLFTFGAQAGPTSSPWVSRKSDLKCQSAQNKVEIKWDTAKAKIGPTAIILNGQDILWVGSPLRMTINSETQSTILEKDQFRVDLPWTLSDHAENEVFQQPFVVNGSEDLLTCSYSTHLVFF